MKLSSLRFSVSLGAVLAVVLLGSVYAAFMPISDDNALNDELLPRDIVGESQAHCLALAIYFEGGSTFESEEGQRHIARVVVERAKSNLRKWGGSDLCDVVFYKKAGVCQFSFACLPLARRTPRPGKGWNQALALAADELEGRSDVLEDSIRYYMNPALTSDRNACRLWSPGGTGSSASRPSSSAPISATAIPSSASAIRRRSRRRSAPPRREPKG